MNNLFDFILRYISWFVFIICEIISLVLLFTYNNYQGSIWMSSANVVSGKMYEVNAGVEQYFSLTDINEQLTSRNLYLEQKVQALSSQIAEKTGDSTFLKHDNYELMKKFSQLLSVQAMGGEQILNRLQICQNTMRTAMRLRRRKRARSLSRIRSSADISTCLSRQRKF